MLLKFQSQELVRNVDTRLSVYKEEIVLSENNKQYESCYLSSPYNGLIGYMQSNHGFCYRMMLAVAGLPLKLIKINKIVQVGNYLFSSNVNLDFESLEVQEITYKLVDKYKSHIIAFKSLNKVVHINLITELEKNDYILVPVRQVYIYRNFEEIQKRRNVKDDTELLNDPSIQIKQVDNITDEMSESLHELYKAIYINKYSASNPEYTAKFIKILSSYLITFLIYRNDKLVGFLMIHKSSEDMIVPLFGYDNKISLYRLISSVALNYAIQNNLVFNSGSGVGDFKLTRGAEEHIEYFALYVNHLNFFRRVAIKILSKIISFFVKL